MMKILTIALYDLMKLSREKSVLIIMFLVPILFTFVMGAAFGSAGVSGDNKKEPKIPVGITNLDHGSFSKELIREMNKDKTIYTVEVPENELAGRVADARVEVGFVIPEDFSSRLEKGQATEIRTLKLPSSSDFMAIQSIMSSSLSKLRVKEGTRAYFKEVLAGRQIPNLSLVIDEISAKVDENLQKPALISVEMTKHGKIVSDKGFNAKSQVSVGVLVMFVMFSVIFGAGEVLEEKKINTWGRLSAAPVTRATMVLGKIAGTFLRGWVQLIVLMIFGSLFMGVQWKNSLGSSIIVLSVFLLAVTSLGLLLSAMVKTNSQLGAFSSVLIVCSSMLSGCYWPVDMQPAVMQKIAMIFPQYWAVKAISNTVGSGLGISSVGMHLSALAAMAVVFFSLSLLIGGFRVDFKRSIPVVENLGNTM
ncbi:MAG: ABC transporter permease [Clostridia bacterium]|nr:ABC transporter permease [Clostridia bacterium]